MRERLKPAASIFRAGDGEFIGFAIVAVCLCYLVVLLASLLTLTGSLTSINEAVTVAGRTAAMASSLEEARENAQLAAESAVTNNAVSDVTAEVEYVDPDSDWTAGTFVKVTVSGHAETLDPVTTGTMTRSSVVCVEYTYGTYGVTGYEDMTTDEATMEVASKIYSVFKKLGWSDEQVAGALGNISVESGLDPTAVEGIFSEPFVIGERKRSLFNSCYPFVPNSAMEDYMDVLQNATSVHINLNGYYDSAHGGHCCGLGIIQFTGPRAFSLMDYANEHGAFWYDIDIQLQCMIDTNGGDSSAGMLRSYAGQEGVSVSGATYWWLNAVEGVSVASEQREAAAEAWYGRIPNLTYDEAYAERIISAANGY